jgi:DNA-binding CsgD family transcriptional regulator
LKIVAAVLDSRPAVSAGSREEFISLVEDGRTVHLDDEQLRREFAPLMPRLRSQAARTGRARRSCSFRWLGPSRTWYRIDLQRMGERMHADARREVLPYHLTDRELEVLDRLCVGATNAEVARHLCLSERTVAHHVERILEKLSARTRTAAVAKAIHEGILLTPPPFAALRTD